MTRATPPSPEATAASSGAQQPAPSEPPSGARRVVSRVQAWRERNARRETVLFLVAGFLFDVLTLSRIDDVPTLLQQGASLGLLGTLLLLEQRYALRLSEPRGLWARAWRYSEDAVHFLFGSLLSSFALFYFRSANVLTSFVFLGVMFALLVLNELPRFRALGPVMRVALYSLCVTSYLAYLLPVLAGLVSPWLFTLAVLLTGGLVAWAGHTLARWTGSRATAVRQVMVPGLGVQALLLLLYFLRITPPVPLAVDWMGIFHDVQREKGTYVLSAEHKTFGFWAREVRELGPLHLLDAEQWPYWKFWQTGDQDFRARAGDKVMAFVRVFAPRRFDDQVVGRWYYDDPQRGWVPRGEFAQRLQGGREQGFRSRFAMTYRGVPGTYRVDITTLGGHVIGRMHVNVEDDPSTEPRVFQRYLESGGRVPSAPDVRPAAVSAGRVEAVEAEAVRAGEVEPAQAPAAKSPPAVEAAPAAEPGPAEAPAPAGEPGPAGDDAPTAG